jgi:MraZ protein
MNLVDEKLDELTAMLFADARQLPFDVTGRIVLPRDLIEHAGIGGEVDTSVLFVGRGQSFQIWEPAAFAAHQSDALKRLQSKKPNLILRQ